MLQRAIPKPIVEGEFGHGLGRRAARSVAVAGSGAGRLIRPVVVEDAAANGIRLPDVLLEAWWVVEGVGGQAARRAARGCQATEVGKITVLGRVEGRLDGHDVTFFC